MMKSLVPERSLRPCDILVVLDNPLKVEVQKGKAFSAPSLGRGLMMPMKNAGIQRSDVQMTYLLNFYPGGGIASAVWDNKQSQENFIEVTEGVLVRNYLHSAINRLRLEIQLVKPKVIVAAGKWAFFFLTLAVKHPAIRKSQFGALLQWRASHLQCHPHLGYMEDHTVIPILPPASVFRLAEASTYIGWDAGRIARVSKQVRSPALHEEPWHNYVSSEFADAESKLIQFLQFLDSSQPTLVSVDIETERGYMDSIAFSVETDKSLTIPLCRENKDVWTEHEELQLTALMVKVLTHKNARIAGQNFTYDKQYIRRFWGVEVKLSVDTMLMSHVYSPALPKSLAELSAMCCGYHRYWKDEGKISQGVSRESRWRYNGKDTCITLEVAKTMEQVFASVPQLKIPLEFQTMKVVPKVTKLMNRGLRVDLRKRKQRTSAVIDLVRQIETTFERIGLGGYSLSSPKQVNDMLYNFMQAPPQYGATGNLSSGKVALMELSSTSGMYKHFCELILLYRSYKVLLKTFLMAKLDMDNRLRCYYKVAGTDTYRLASTKNAFGTGLNLQNVPGKKTSYFGMSLPSIQELIIPDEGHDYFDADLGSADARIVMAESGSQIMKDIFETGEDLYATLAGEYHNRPILYKENPEDKKIRKIFKAIAHATHYLGAAAGIARNTGLLVEEVRRVQKWYFDANPELLKYQNRIKGWVDHRGYLENVFGYRYYFLDSKRKTIYQQAAAWIPQSTIGILINHVMVDVDDKLEKKGVQIQLQVHDSIAGQFPSHKQYLKQEILDCFKIPLEYESGTLIIPADMETSKNSWGECK